MVEPRTFTCCSTTSEGTFIFALLLLLVKLRLRVPNGYRATSEYSRRYPRRTSCKDHAIRSRYAVLLVHCPASGKGDPEAAAQYRIRRSPHRRFVCSSTP